MAATTSVPRFLLPQSGLIWRRIPTTAGTAGGHRILLRFASTTKDKSNQRVLEKPERFNPPSHGARLPRNTTPRHYGGDLGAAEVQAQKVKEYPGLRPPPGSWGSKYWENPWIHAFVALSTLGSLTFYVFTENFKRNSPFYDMVPSWGDLLRHPITSVKILGEVIRLDSMHNAAIVQEKRQHKVDDMVKRTEYRKAHGLPEEQGFFSMRREQRKPPMPAPDAMSAKAAAALAAEEARARLAAEAAARAAAAEELEDGGIPAGTAR
ncbi:hypothetical protein B0H66DRAFT_481030 [Apodospora peruviana]|uniref:Uncharacterized protein n=1 Tax=Apodospora peruviana TaxID=516989 RepID=A0AAE0HYV1_9PEZI|nr:hypothetical protein B0H66DRAFT_481030 [Apodospora peruviana]